MSCTTFRTQVFHPPSENQLQHQTQSILMLGFWSVGFDVFYYSNSHYLGFESSVGEIRRRSSVFEVFPMTNAKIEGAKEGALISPNTSITQLFFHCEIFYIIKLIYIHIIHFEIPLSILQRCYPIHESLTIPTPFSHLLFSMILLCLAQLHFLTLSIFFKGNFDEILIC